MAITITTSPQRVMPLYNPIYFRPSSTNVNQPNFNFIYDVYTGTTGTTLINTERLPVYPDGLGQYSPAGILQSLLSYDIPVNTIGGVSQANTMTPYYIYFGEEYGSLTTGVTTYRNLAWASGYTFTSVLNYDEVPSWNYTAYTPQESVLYGASFLTKGPNTVYVRENDRETISFLNLSGTTTGASQFMVVDVYAQSGGSVQFVSQNGPVLSGTAKNTLIHFGIGPWNLNQIPNALLTGGTQPMIDFDRDSYYTVNFYSAGDAFTFPTPLFSARTYSLDSSCTKYQPVRLMWLNSLGGWDYYNFILVSRTTMNVSRLTYKRNLSYNYSVGNLGYTISDIQARESVQITSDWLGDQQSQWMKELLKSKAVFELRSDGSYLPIIIDANSAEIKKTINDKLIHYEIPYTYAYKVGTMNG